MALSTYPMLQTCLCGARPLQILQKPRVKTPSPEPKGSDAEADGGEEPASAAALAPSVAHTHCIGLQVAPWSEAAPGSRASAEAG